MRDLIIAKLSKNINFSNLEVIDESYLHQGHIGYNPTGESHFKIIIASSDLNKIKKIEAHRLINKILRDEIKNIHALSIELK